MVPIEPLEATAHPFGILRCMTKLSPAYLKDSSEGIDRNTRDYLDQHYFYKLAHLSHSNPRLLVIYAGGNGIGKSVLSARISRELSGLVLENDAIKQTLLTYDPSITHEALGKTTWQYTMDLYKRLPELTPNGLVVRDGVIQWYFDRILPIFESRGYELFIVRYDISDEMGKELISRRGDKQTVSVKRLHEIMIDQKIHLKRFDASYKASIVLTDHTCFDHDSVINELKTKIRNINDNNVV